MTTASTAKRKKDHQSIEERNQLIQANTGLVYFLAKRLHGTLADDAEFDELVSAGMLGLMRAAELFEAERGLAFATFATTRIRGAMLDELRRIDRLPRSLRAKDRQLQSVRNTLAHALGRAPEPREVAAAAGVDVSTLWRWEDEMRASAVLTLDARGDEDEFAEEAHLRERIAAPDVDVDVELDREIEHERLHEAMEHLSPDERLVLAMSFFEDKTLQEIAPRIGVTESGASRIRARALRHLRTSLEHRISRTAA
jgi:RNA polymerase sigma factor for flagellar operon FliA